MATNQDTTTGARECWADFCGRLNSAGVSQALINEMLDRITSEHNENISKAARLFYHRFGEQGPLTPMDFSDELHNIRRRMWGLVAAIEGILVDSDDEGEVAGVRQLVHDVARETDRLVEAFDAERWSWVERKHEALS